ncbi:hypothetical protein Poli38472_004461 [Pythium oligandrum]|uniref:Amino acid transporter transmembrane domain-containing protein n=1 Tax=Pythium oligandrum TaxID=41045 RepID=A0A8K1CA54_PYTOL|nr:hypothetical protein Poli38472_004461 [Pythium oligandrum]|eukprot:TMW59392.1 hypothetical protein Poli38472_004461 [Pythium oligandrum]
MLSEDGICVALLFCATFGVGSMSFGSVYAASGPLLASLAIYFLSACNLHASVAVSKALTVVPLTVRSFSDLGYHAYGTLGRRVVLLSEAGVCFLTPIAFLILGGTSLLPQIFDEVFERTRTSNEWIVIMAASVLPIVLIPTLRGTAPLCLLGAIVAVLTDAICIIYSLEYLPMTPRETQIQVTQVIPTFGTIMFALGTAIIIPPIQRQHSDPSRVGNLVSLTLLFITSIYMFIGIITYYQFGCMAPDTLLDQLPSGNWRRAASAFMLLHVMIAFPVLLNPTLFDLERYLLGKDSDIEVLQQSIALRASKMSAGKPILSNAPSVASLDDDGFLYGSNSPANSIGVYFQAHSPTGLGSSSTGSNTPAERNVPDEYAALTFTARDRLCSALIRVLTIVAQTFLALMLQDCFMDILSLIGATAVTVSCMIMPCLCYLKVYPIPLHLSIGRLDRAMCYLIIVSSTILGIYCTIVSANNISMHLSKFELFTPVNVTEANVDDDSQYPFCHVGERN